MRKLFNLLLLLFLTISVLSIPQPSFAQGAPPPPLTCPVGFTGPDATGNCCAIEGGLCRPAVQIQNQSTQAIQTFCTNNPTAPECRPTVTNGDYCDPPPGSPPGIGMTPTQLAPYNHVIRTSIGCIPTDLNGFFQGLIAFSFVIGGAIALILMIIGAFQMITSGGNPEGIKKGREQFIAAATGLVFVVLATTLLRVAGVQILGIPNF